MTDMEIAPLAKNSMYLTPLISLSRLPRPYPKATKVINGSAILPMTLAIASLRQTRKLRRQTGKKRRLNEGSW